MGPGLSGKGVCFFGQVWGGGGGGGLFCFPSQHLPTPVYFCFAVFLYYNFHTICYTLLLNPCEQKKLRHVEIRKKKSTNWSGESNCQPVWLLFPKVSLLCKQTNFKYYNILRICRVDPQSSMSEFRNSQTTSCALTVTALYLDEYQKIWKFWMKEILLQTNFVVLGTRQLMWHLLQGRKR